MVSTPEPTHCSAGHPTSEGISNVCILSLTSDASHIQPERQRGGGTVSALTHKSLHSLCALGSCAAGLHHRFECIEQSGEKWRIKWRLKQRASIYHFLRFAFLFFWTRTPSLICCCRREMQNTIKTKKTKHSEHSVGEGFAVKRLISAIIGLRLGVVAWMGI